MAHPTTRFNRRIPISSRTANPVFDEWKRLAALLLLPLVNVATVGCLLSKKEEVRPVSDRVLTICELFKDIGAYSGKKVAIRGIYYFGLRQVNCGQEVFAGGKRWPTAIDLVDSNLAVSRAVPAKIETDRASWDRLDRLAIQVGRAGRKAEVWVTVRGELRGPARHLVPNSGIVGGYGQFGAYPAQLVVESVEDLQVKPTPTFDYREMLPPKASEKQ